ncbi:MAG: Gldg family protein [Clostridia bacterium]|nr:Gldg family protein [Clostridia bacterium]
MKKMKAFFKKLTQNRKLRCGGYSVLLTVLAVAICLGGIALADRLEEKYALTADFSYNAATTQGEVTRHVLSGLEKKVHIYALMPEGGENDTLLQLLNRYDASSDWVTVSYDRILENPALLNKFATDIGNKKITRDCLIVWCEENNRARVLDEDDYYLYTDYDIETGTVTAGQILYEKRITEAILFVTGDELPGVQVLAGHGELTKADVALMEDLLVSANYRVEWLVLDNGDVPDPQSPLMILRPVYDFTEKELQILTDYARAGGDFFIAANYDDPLNMENYNALLRSYGVEAYPGIVVAQADDLDAYYADMPDFLMPYMQETNATLPLIESARDRLIMPRTRAFRILPMEGSYTHVYPMLETGRAYIRNLTDGLDTTQQQPTDESGYFNIALWTDKMYEDGTLSHAVIIGNADLFCNDALLNNTDSGVFLLQMMRALQGKDPVNLDIVPKNGVREGLKLDKITPAVLVTFLLPVLVICGAMMVLLPRKSR